MVEKRRSAGEGTIFFNERLQRWQAQLTLNNGKKKTKTAKTQGEVKRWLLEQRKAIEDNLSINVKDVTLEVFLKRYMQDIGNHTLSPKSISSYQYIIDKHILPDLGKVKLTQLRADHLQKVYSDKLNAGLSKRTVLYIHQVLHKAIGQALKWNLVIRNVTELAEPPKNKRRAPDVLSVSQIRQLLDFLETDRLYPLYFLAVSTGMREGELLGLHWEDVDLTSGMIFIKHQAQQIPGQGMIIKEPKTESSKRRIELPEKALDCLRSLYVSSGGPGLVFKTSNGTPFSQRNLLRHFHQSLDKAGLPRVTFHSLRHFTATSLLQQGVHPKLVQSLLGHSTIGLTMDTYSHVIKGMGKETAEKMNDLLR